MKCFLSILVLTALLWVGCGGKSSSSTTTVAVTISPTTASIAGGATQQFTPTVTGTTNLAVTWSVNGENGGDALIGTISTTGLYTAPTRLPTTTSVTITATSQADTTKTATAVVTLTAPTVTISISPTSANVLAGATQQFTPTVTSTDNNTAVTWSVNGFAGGNSTVGTVNSSGVYTAPLSPPKESITVTATSQSNTAFAASAPVTVQFSNASLSGNYVFLVSQPDNGSGSGFAFRGGTFVADGHGSITGGVTDSNSSSTGPLANVAIVSSGSTYSVGPDGRGAVTIVDANGTHTFSFALTSNTRGQLIEFDSAGVASGLIRQQDQTAISSLSGSFVFALVGDNAGPSAAVGQLSFNAGTISGTEDTSTNGNVVQGTALAGSVSLGAGGRGTATINTSQFIFYIVDASTLVLIDVDPSGSARLAGTAYAQSSTFSIASLLSSAFFVNGNAVSGNKPYALAGRFDTNGSGSFSNGIFDVNNSGTIPATSSFTSGANYNLVGGNGRYVLSTGTTNFIVWLASAKLGVIMESDATATATGLLFQQQTGFQSVTGGFEFAVAGASADGTTAQASDAQVTTNGFDLSGNQDTNSGGQVQSATLASTSRFAITSATTERGTASFLSLSYGVYFVSSDRFVIFSATPNGAVLSGIAERQCSDCTF